MLSLTTERLTLRDYSAGDLGTMYAFRCNRDISKYMHWPDVSFEAYEKELQGLLKDSGSAARRFYHLLIVLKASEKPIGLVALNIQCRNAGGGVGVLGFLLEKQHWRKGYASEATKRLLDYGFDQLGLHKISAQPESRNRRSLRLLRNIGMRREGVLRKEGFIDNEWRDISLYSILKDQRRQSGDA